MRQTNTSDFGYNSAHQRVDIQEYTGTAGSLELQSHHRYIWSGHRPIKKRDATGAITLSTYTGNGQLDAPEAGGSGRKLYYARDHLGSIRNVYSSTGEEIASYDYSPYGKRTLVSGSEEIEFGYTGHHYHSASKTILTLYRGYDPNTGRWLSPDPLEEAGGINLYRYSLNNPINMVDPNGLIPIETGFDIASAAYSGYQFSRDPSALNAGFLAWDVLAAFTPYVPGSYVARGASLFGKGTQLFGKTADFCAELIKKRCKNKAPNSGVNFVKNTGTHGGTRATTRQINAAQSEFADLGIGFNRSFKGNGGSFSFGSSPVVSVPKHPTQIQLFHELTHARQFGQLGREGYIGLGKYAREWHVFNNIWKNRSNFNRAEVKDAINYQRRLRSKFNRGAID